jgi:hypothetical protein
LAALNQSNTNFYSWTYNILVQFSTHESYSSHVAIVCDVFSVLTCSILELVDAAVDPALLEPIKETIVKVDGVKVQY